MPIENAIEVFNCSLCTYCETSLDGLASHIRKHIKPEPHEKNKGAISGASNISLAIADSNVRDKSISYMNGLDSSAATSNSDNRNMEIVESNETLTESNPQCGDGTPLSPRIEVLNPRTVVVNGTHSNLLSSDSQKPKTPVSTQKGNFIVPPPMVIEKTPQISYPRNILPQQSVRHANPNVITESRQDNIPVTRYVQLHSRETPYIEINSTHHPFPNQYVANISGKPTIVHTDLVPSVVSGKGGYQELQAGPREVMYRSIPVSERQGNIPKSIAPAPPPPYVTSPNQSNRGHATTNIDVRLRSNYPFDIVDQNNIHHNYQPRPILPQDNTYRANTSPSHQINPHTPKSHRTTHSSAASPLSSPYMSPSSNYSHVKAMHVADDRMKQYHNRVSNIQLSDIQKQQSPHSQPIMGVPNNGTIFINPEQLMLGNGNSHVNQLAGILVVPLKKTCDVACQTDFVYISNSENEGKVSRSIQTDLLMGQVSEHFPKSPAPLFDTFRTTDDLFECLVCGEEFASDHHLQEHMSKWHTHVCEKCYHSSTNISDHNMHITDCGNRHSEMICMECNTSFVSLKRLNQHRSKIHNVRMPFRCGVCNVPFETHEAVMKHIGTHDMDFPEFKCRYCVKIFQSAEGLSKHFARHKGVDVLHECRFCKKSYNTMNLLQDHISYVHVIRETVNASDNEQVFAIGSPAKPDKNIDEDRVSSSKKYPLCRHCDLAFKNSELMQQHTEICSKNSDAKVSTFVCDVCKEYYSSELQRKQHFKKEHKRNAGFRCPKCSKIYRTWSRLKFHTKQQHLKKTCADCSMIFTKEHVLRKHQEEEHGKPMGQPGDRVYTCSLCNTMLHTLTELMTHRKQVHPELTEMRTADRSSGATMLSYIDNDGYTQESRDTSTPKPGISDIIIKRSPSSEELQNASHKCKTCGACFEDERRLKNHKGLVHREKLFKCTVCSKSFQYSSQVVWHMRTHRKKDKNPKVSSKLWKSKNKKFPSSKITKPKITTKSNYVCQFCGAKFSQEKLLNNHKGSIHKIKLFSCEICNIKFGHSTELIWHLRTCRAKFKRKYPGMDLPIQDNKSAKLDDSTIDDDGYVCHVCDNAFTHFENYQSHLKLHPGEEIPSQNNSTDCPKPKTNDNLVNSVSKKLKKEESNQNAPSISSPTHSSSSRLRTPSLSQTTFLDGIGAEELLSIEPEFDQSVGEYICPICQKTTRSMTGMKTHYGRVHGVWSKETSHKDTVKVKKVEDLIWPCKNCDRQFSSLGSLRHHSSVIHGFSVNEDEVDVIRGVEIEQSAEVNVGSYSCPYCEASFSKSKSIRVHAFKKHGTILTDAEVNAWRNGGSGNTNSNNINPECIRFKCFKCKSKFRTTKAIRVHALKRHDHLLSKKEIAKSKIRIKISADASQSSQEEKNAVPGQLFPCDVCGRVFTNHRAYFTHYRQAHRDATEPLLSPKKPSRNEITNYNPSSYQDTNTTDDPIPPSPVKKQSKVSIKKERHSVDTIDCPKCDKFFTQSKALFTHLYQAHKITKEKYKIYWPDGVPTLPSKKAKCPTCDRMCVDNRAMQIHIFKAHGILYKDMTKDFEMEEESELSGMNDVINGDSVDNDTVYDENELRVVEAELGPPICFICGRFFKSRRALMTHEYKYHGIRWVGNKRLFPAQVRNVPNLRCAQSYSQRSVDRSSPNPKINLNKIEENVVIEKLPEISKHSLYSEDNPLDENVGSISEVDSDLQDGSEPTIETYDFACPICSTGYHKRRALTTHLCRIHKYRKLDIQKLFGEMSDTNNVDNENIDNTENDVDKLESTEMSSNGETYDLSNDVAVDINDKEDDCYTGNKSDTENFEDIEEECMEMNGDIDDSNGDDIGIKNAFSVFTGRFDENRKENENSSENMDGGR